MTRAFVKRLWKCKDGAAAVEFALTLPILIVVVLGVMQFGQAFWAQNALHYAVEQTARCMTYNTSSCNSTTATKNYASTISGYVFDPSVFSPTTSADCGTGAGNGNKVDATYPVQFDVFIYRFSMSLTANSCFPSIS